MAYSTGSGDYVAMMAAVLAHAIADGWTEAGGVSTGWPIISPSGRIRGVDWSSYTASEADMTAGGDGLTKTQRFLRLGLGATPAGATANAAAGGGWVCPNIAYAIIAWHIFSDISLNEHIHVVFQFSNGPNGNCYSHFSFGEIDKGGLTYNSIAYITATDRRGYAVDNIGGIGVTNSGSGGNWNTLNRAGVMWSGNYGETDDGFSALSYMIHGTTAPVPNGTGGWPAWDTQINNGSMAWAPLTRYTDTAWPSLNAERDGSFANASWWLPFNAATGFANLAPIPFCLINGTNSTSRIRWMGMFPNVRFVGMDGINPGDEITIGSDVWKCFPLTRITPWNQINVQFIVSSGYAGYAYKKVP